MSLHYLTGIDNMGRLSKAERKAKRQARREERKESGGVLRKVATVGLAPSRAAFLAAVNLNVLKLGNRLAKLGKQNPKAFEDFWIKFGGTPSELKKAVQKGSGVSLALDPATTAAISAALPIITVLLKTLKENRIADETTAAEESEALKSMQTDLENNPDVNKDVAAMPSGTTTGIIKAGGGGFLDKIKSQIKSGATAPSKAPAPSPTDSGTSSNLPLLIGGAAALLLLPKLMK
jgi:hypothetical protein